MARCSFSLHRSQAMAFTTLFGQKLMSKDGEILTEEALAGKTSVGIYFSAHWCPPCRGFTPKLAQMYNDTFKSKGMEIVFVSSDRDESAFSEYFSEMPWLALPFSERELKAELSKKYKVQGIPSFVILGPDGNTITKDGRDAVMKDPEGTKYPWVPPTPQEKAKIVLETLGSALVEKAGGKPLGLYFSAHWCPPCRGFTPKLAEYYENGLKEKLEIIFVSSDRSQADFDGYFEEMPWLALPFEMRKEKEELSSVFGVQGIPSFVVLNPDGTIITTEGRNKVMNDPKGELLPHGWLPQPCNDVNDDPSPLNEEQCLIMLAGADSAGASAVKEVASEFYEKAGKEIESMPIQFFWAPEGGVTEQLRKLTGVDGDQLILLDIPDNGGFYICENSKIDADIVKGFKVPDRMYLHNQPSQQSTQGSSCSESKAANSQADLEVGDEWMRWVTMKPQSVDASDTEELLLKQVPNNRTYKGLEYENQGIWKKPFFFVQMADTQFGMLGGGTRGLGEEEAMCNVAVDHINQLKPAFAIVCGDMTNSYPENSSTPLYLQHAEKDAFKRVFSRVDESIPVLCVCGNHDIGDRPNSKTLNIYKKRWGDDYYSFWFGGVKFLVINTQVYKALEKEPYAEDLLRMRKAQDAWLEKELKATEEENPAHLVILSHIPPYIEAPDEEDGYFNLESTTRQELVTMCKAKGASKWLCGHYHRNSCACDADGKFEVVVTGAVGCNFKTRPGSSRKARVGLAGEGQMFFTPEMSGFRIVKIRQDSIDHQFYCLSDMPANVDASAPRWKESSDSVSN